MTSGTELNDFLGGFPGYQGVFAADELPSIIKSGDSLIVNYDNADEPGSHWCAMRFPFDRPAEWFDSFGKRPDGDDRVLHRSTKFLEYLEKHSQSNSGNKVWWNRTDYQSKKEDTCGIWAGLFIIGGLSLPGVDESLMSMADVVRDKTIKDLFRSTQAASS
jgi:hypothetical protein